MTVAVSILLDEETAARLDADAGRHGMSPAAHLGAKVARAYAADLSVPETAPRRQGRGARARAAAAARIRRAAAQAAKTEETK